ncbi:hypothetical protein NXX61_22840 [Bacteroides ovatus]|nr:hypothetical protein [Bacteroides ovatus]
MKQEIINRIKQLGGNVTNVKGTSLSEDLCAITFNTALYKSRKIRLGYLPKTQNRLKVWAIGWMKILNCSILTERHSIRKW